MLKLNAKMIAILIIPEGYCMKKLYKVISDVLIILNKK